LYSQQQKANVNKYLSDHWNGSLPLWKSYWVNGILLATLAALIFGGAVGFALGLGGINLNDKVWNILSPFLAAPIVVWSSVGIWRSGGNYTIANPQKKFWCWGRLARVAVVIGVIRMMVDLIQAITA
jgi:hypothetical protein